MTLFKAIMTFLPDEDRRKTEVFKQPYLDMFFELANYEQDFHKAVPSVGADRYITELYPSIHEIKVLSNGRYHLEYVPVVLKNDKYNGNVAFRIKTSRGNYTKFIFTRLKEDDFIKIIRSLTNLALSFRYNTNYITIGTNIFKKRNRFDVSISSKTGKTSTYSVFIPPVKYGTYDVKGVILDYIQGHNKKVTQALRIPKNRKIKSKK